MGEDARATISQHGAEALPWDTEAIEKAKAVRAEKAKNFGALFGKGGELKQRGGAAITDVSGFGGRQVAVVRCVTEGRMRGYRDEGSFKSYFSEMPWLALPY